jgi:hypothetical protein
MSSISRLQEYCQQHQLGVPQYSHTYLSGPSHHPTFRVTIKIANRDEQSTECPSFKLGKEYLANIVYNQITSEFENKNQKFESKIETKRYSETELDLDNIGLGNYLRVCLVDYENVNLTLNDVHTYSDILFILVFAKNCSKPMIQSDNVRLLQCSFIGKDVADTLMIFFAGMFKLKFKPIAKDIFIFTKDHYGDALARLMGGQHICQIADLA